MVKTPEVDVDCTFAPKLKEVNDLNPGIVPPCPISPRLNDTLNEG